MPESKFESVTIEAAIQADATAVASLIESLSGPFFNSPNREGAENFLASISETAVGAYLPSERYMYIVARKQLEVVGVAALRDNTHLFHLFVAKAFQGCGIGRSLWHVLRQGASERGSDGMFTVNSSLNAIPVYEAFGFIAEGAIVTTHGVSFQAMRYGAPAA